MESAKNLTDLKSDIPCEYRNSGGFCDICKKVRFEIPVIIAENTTLVLRIGNVDITGFDGL
jgi:hypothetical protein